ncbi:MAG: hypothetical protein QM831_20985 [Kofleriaceae bacterium]
MRFWMLFVLAGCAVTDVDDDDGWTALEDTSPLDDIAPQVADTDPMAIDPAAPAEVEAVATANDITTTLTFDDPIATVSPLQAGANHRWVDRGYGVLRNDGTIDPTMIAKAKAMGVGVLRYPAGTMANMWSLDRAKANGCQFLATMARPRDGAPFEFTSKGEATTPYNPAKHIEFARAVGADTDVMVPFVNNTPAGAAAFVKYMNVTNHYNIKHWEVGNEPYFGNQRYWMSATTKTAVNQYIDGDHTTRFTNQPLAQNCDLADAAKGDGTSKDYQLHYAPVKDAAVFVDGQKAVNATIDAATGDVHFAVAPRSGAKLTATYTLDHAGFGAFVAAMKAVDPSIDVCSAWGTTDFVDAYKQPLDCVASHVYSIPKDVATTPPADLYRLLMEGEDTEGDKLAGLVADLKAKHPNAYVEVTESGFLLSSDKADFPEATQMHAVYTVSLFTRFLNLGLPLAQAGDLTSTSMRSLISRDHGTLVTSVNALALHLFSTITNLVGKSIGSTLTPVPHSGTADHAFESLKVAVVRGALGVHHVLIANRDLQRDAVITIPTATGAHRWLIAGDPFAYNSAAAPNTLKIVQADISGKKFRIPAHSVAYLRLTE